eukprot:SAG22_NODE_2808_length_2191_cov_1.463671_4_plen_34_part_00
MIKDDDSADVNQADEALLNCGHDTGLGDQVRNA